MSALQSIRRTTVAVLVAMVAWNPAHALAQRTEVGPGFNLYSPEDDVAIGQQFIRESEPQLDIIEDEILAEYVNRLGQQLALEAPGYTYPYQFKLVNDTGINAFALPGGPIYLNRGVIEEADREAEVAGVLAHEIAHVALRHGTNQASKGQLVQTPLAILGGIFGGGGGVTSILTQVGVGFAANSLFLKYSRDAERQADILGAQILFDAGYDPTGMPEFFEKLEAAGGNRGAEFFSSHPNPGNRAELVSEEIDRLGELPPTFNDNFSDFRRIQARLGDVDEPSENGDRAGTAPIERPSGPPDAPASSYERYRSRTLEFRHPSNWTVVSQDDALIVAPEGGQTPNGLAYGVFIGRFEPASRSGRRVSIEEATDQLIAQLRESNPSMQVGQGYRRGSVDRRPALSVGLAMNSPVGGVERDWLLTSFGPDGGLYYFIGAAPRAEFDTYLEAFQNVFQSIRFR